MMKNGVDRHRWIAGEVQYKNIFQMNIDMIAT